MDILVLGGTRYFGIHLVENLLKQGHNVTIGTRGLKKDPFGSRVSRIVLERTDSNSISEALGDKHFHVIYDNLAYCSNDVKILLDSVKTERYIMTSTMSVYKDFHMNITEEDFDPLKHDLIWCKREDFTYDEVKRQAECALFQIYKDVPSVAVRFPYVIGEDDYTKRFLFYVEHVIKEIPMNVDNLDENIGFIYSKEAGKFLAWLCDKNFTGIVNASSIGSISIKTIIEYVEKKIGKKAILTSEGEVAPYNETPSFSINTNKAHSLGFEFSHLDNWIYELIDNFSYKF